jgi:hypothetical protein
MTEHTIVIIKIRKQKQTTHKLFLDQKTTMKTRRLEKSGVFILLKACPMGFFHGKTASPKFQFSSPGHRT